MNIDHVVLWVSNQERSLDFFVNVVGLEPVRAREFAEGSVGFPSVRLSEMSILDLMDKNKAPSVREFTGGGDETGGSPVNHVCLSMDESEYAALRIRLVEYGHEPKPGGAKSFGARGRAEESAYFQDPDGNILEMRHYGS